jgi:hypothetical protein
MASSSGGSAFKMTRGKAAASACAACASLAVYEAYRRGYFTKTTRSLKKIVDSAQDAAETLGTLAKDTKEFLSSDSEVVPQSIRQALKLASCSETQEVVQTHVQATIKGVLNGNKQNNSSDSNGGAAGGKESNESEGEREKRIMNGEASTSEGTTTEEINPKAKVTRSNSMVGATLDKIFSKKGTGFFSIVAASVAKQAIGTLMENASEQTSDGEAFEKYKDILMSDEGKQFVSDLLVTLVVEFTEIYMDKTIHINAYDQMLETAVKPQHKGFVEHLCVKLCKVWTETVMAPAPPAATAAPVTNKAIGNNSMTPAYQGGDLSLCTPREYPSLIPSEGLCSSNCGSPNSVCSGLKHEGSSATSEEGLNNASSQMQQAGTASGTSSSQANIVKDILSSAASDTNVRNFLVSVASSSSAATVKVLLEAFVPSWLLSDRIKTNNGTAFAPTASMDTKVMSGQQARQRMYALVCASLVVVVAMWMFRPSKNLNEYYSASSGFYAPLS